MPKRTRDLLRQNLLLARKCIGKLGRQNREALNYLSEDYGFSIALGDLVPLEGKWYVTHTGLLRLAQRCKCFGISARPVRNYCDPALRRWIFKATVYKSSRVRGFIGYGDADPSNVSQLVRGAEMRVAETRAVNRALRKAYGIGLCSVEELGWEPKTYAPSDPHRFSSAAKNNGHQNGQPRLRDRLCLLIRQHQLDANLVKAYAADYCGTPNLRDATRDQIETFITNLADWATKDRAALLCRLNSYAKPQGVSS
jgi:hypothetical protein